MASVRLSEIATVITKGTTPTSLGFDFVDNGINFVKIESITDDGSFIPTKFGHITEECNKKLARSVLLENDVLFSIAGAIGRTAIVNKSILPANTNQALAIIRIPDGIVDYSYLKYVLESPIITQQFEKKKQGVAQLNISLKDIGDFVIPLPSMSEQKEIVSKLRHADSLISLRKQQIAKLDELVKARFVEMFGDPVSNPKGWEMAQLSSLAEIKIGPFGSLLHKEDYVSDEHPLVNPSHIVDGRIVVDNELTVNDAKYEEMVAYHLHPGDVVLGRRGEMGRCAVVYEQGMLCGTGSLIIRPSDMMHPYFLQKIISYPTFKKAIEDMAVGVTMMNLNVPIVSSFMIPVLPRDQQDAYLAFVAQTDQQKLTIQHSLAKLELLKKALMQKYFG